MSKFKFIIWIIAFLAIQNGIFATSVQTNKQIIDSVFNSFYSRIAFKLTESKIYEVYIVQNSDYQYFINKLTNELYYKNIKVANTTTTTLQLNINEFNINYLEVKDNLNREITINASIYIIEKNGELKLLDNLNTIYNDVIEMDDIDRLENEMFTFTKGKLPKSKKSFFDEIIEPVIVVGTAVLTVVLFFSVRTK